MSANDTHAGTATGLAARGASMADSHPFVPATRASDQAAWELPIVPAIANQGGVLFGGCALAAAVWTREQAAALPCVYASAQLVTAARVDSVMAITTVVTHGEGRPTVQMAMRGEIDGALTLAAHGAVGARRDVPVRVFAPPPTIGAVGAGRPLSSSRDGARGTVHERMDVLVEQGRTFDELDGTPGEAATRLWVRMPECSEAYDATALAVVSDLVTFGVLQSLGLRGQAQTIDSTIRFVQNGVTEWVLVTVELDAATRGYAHGAARMHSSTGELLAVASQSCVLRGD
jgi:acyl-CoA thioesterase II